MSVSQYTQSLKMCLAVREGRTETEVVVPDQPIHTQSGQNRRDNFSHIFQMKASIENYLKEKC